MFLFKLVDDLVDSVISQILKQVTVVQETVAAPLSKLVVEVTGHGTWKGAGAQAFVDHVNDKVLPMIVGIAITNGNFASTIDGARKTMLQAIGEANNKAKMLLGVLNIF